MNNTDNNRADDSDDELELEQKYLAIIKKTLPALRFTRNTAKVLRRLSSAGTDTLVNALEAGSSWFQLEKARNERLIAELSQLPGSQSDTSVKVVDNLIQEQRRIDLLVLDAIEHVKAHESADSFDEIEEGEVLESSNEIGDDWLECFRREAAVRTQGEMRETFTRILAGEIRQPGKFSIRTLRTVSGLSQSTAAAFSHAASIRLEQRFTVRHPDGRREHKIMYPMVPDLEGKGRLCDLSSEYFAELVENGLLQSIVGSVYYGAAAVDPVTNVVHMPFTHQNRRWGLKPMPPDKRPEDLRINGACFTSVGAELLRIVDIEENDQFLDRLRRYFRSCLWEMVPVEDSRK